MSSDCHRAMDRLELSRQERLSPALLAQLQDHLGDCPACRQEQQDTEPLNLFAGLTRGGLPAGVANYVLGGLRVEEERRDDGAWSAASIWPALASLAAAAALIMVWAISGSESVAPGDDLWLEAHAMNDVVATVEDIRSPTAEILALTLPEPSGRRTEVILIVDGSMDL